MPMILEPDAAIGGPAWRGERILDAIGHALTDLGGVRTRDGCVPKCANACDCETATGGLPKVECTNVCPTCKPAWVCEQGAYLATSGTTDTCF